MNFVDVLDLVFFPGHNLCLSELYYRAIDTSLHKKMFCYHGGAIENPCL